MTKIRTILFNAAALTAVAAVTAAAVTFATPDGSDRYDTALPAHVTPTCGICWP